MPVTAKRITDDVADVLQRSRIEGANLFLPSGQLDSRLYRQVNDTLERLGGKWNRKAKCHIFDGNPSVALAEVLDTGKAPAKNALAFFPTPPEVAEQMVRLARLDAEKHRTPRILEPSAGEGHLATTIRALCPHGDLTLVEIDEGRCRTSRAQGFTVFQADFLVFPDEGLNLGPFDHILMNPPFAVPGNALAYIDHILHAESMLAPGGILVSVCPVGFTFATKNRKLTTFRDRINGAWHGLPEDAFSESGTDTKTCLVVLSK